MKEDSQSILKTSMLAQKFPSLLHSSCLPGNSEIYFIVLNYVLGLLPVVRAFLKAYAARMEQ